MQNRHGLEIRAPTPQDAPFIAELLSECSLPISPEILTKTLGQIRNTPGTALIANEYGPPSAIIVLHWFQTLTTLTPTARITTLLVTPSRRRQGLARLLLKSASQAARSAGCATIELATTNPTLQAFCQATGFTQTATTYTRSLRKQQ